ADEIGRKCGQPLIASLRPPVLDREVLSLDIAGFAQSLAEGGEIGCARARRGAIEEADHRHRLLLRPGGQRPQRRRAAEKREEFSPPHSMTSSARSRSVTTPSPP